MIVAGIGILAVYLLLGIVSGKEEIPESVEGIMQPFCRMACFLYKKAANMGIPVFASVQVNRDLESLYRSENMGEIKAEYYQKKLALSLMVGLVGTLLAMIADGQAYADRILKTDGSVVRGSYVEDDIKLNLYAEGTQMDREEFSILVQPQKLSKEQADELHEMFLPVLKKSILGDNASLTEVTKDLLLTEKIEGYPFLIKWESDQPGVLSPFGQVNVPEDGEWQVVLKASITYDEFTWQDLIQINILQPVLSEKEQRHEQLEQLLLYSEEESRGDAKWTLPSNWNGEEVSWKERQNHYGFLLLGLAMLTAAAVFVLSDRDLQEKNLLRQKKMKQEYPDIVHKLVLYLGAGMTVRGAFGKVAEDYEQLRGKSRERMPAYEEMIYTCRELQAGVSEGAAYEHFGKRIGIREYIRLSTFLMQNLKKGSSTLLNRLQEEAAKTYEERLQNSRKLGEEAVTRLLLPMMMMLIVVMIMVMMPAFASMGM